MLKTVFTIGLAAVAIASAAPQEQRAARSAARESRTRSVYVSVLGADPEREATLEGLRSAHGFLQGRIASELSLKRTPTLSFEYDESIDRGMRISSLLDAPTEDDG